MLFFAASVVYEDVNLYVLFRMCVCVNTALKEK